MPKYEYDCPRCGPFADYRPVADYELPGACPDCGAQSPRVLLSFPAMTTRAPTAARGSASADGGFQATSDHASGCRCCSSKSFKIPRKDWVRKLT